MLLPACEMDVDRCLGITTQVRPTEASLLVGEQFRAEAWEVSCDRAEPRQMAVVWSTTDTTVVRVDSLTGQATAAGSGVAEVVARDSAGGYQIGAVDVEVTQP